MTEGNRERKLSDLLRFVLDWRRSAAKLTTRSDQTHPKEHGSSLRQRPGLIQSRFWRSPVNQAGCEVLPDSAGWGLSGI